MPIAHLPGLRMHYVLLEPARPAVPRADVVLVHGLAANVAFWYWTIAPALARANRVLLVDLRGHGRSSMPPTGYTAQAMADDLKAQLDLMQMHSVHLLGHSFGGRVVTQFASCYPESVESVTLADVLLRPLQGRPLVSAPGWRAYRGILAREGIRFDETADEPILSLLEGLARLRLRLDDDKATAHNLGTVGPFAGSAGRGSAVQWLRLLEQTTARQDIPSNDGLTPQRLARLRAPTLLIYGQYSQALPTARALHTLWPHAEVEIVPNAGHFFPVARPDRLLTAVDRFMNTHATGN